MEHVRHVVVRNFIFSAEDRVLRYDNLLPYAELNPPSHEVSATKSPFLVGPQRDTLKVQVIILPHQPYKNALQRLQTRTCWSWDDSGKCFGKVKVFRYCSMICLAYECAIKSWFSSPKDGGSKTNCWIKPRLSFTFLKTCILVNCWLTSLYKSTRLLSPDSNQVHTTTFTTLRYSTHFFLDKDCCHNHVAYSASTFSLGKPCLYNLGGHFARIISVQ